jgi:2'-5' RNA ligase
MRSFFCLELSADTKNTIANWSRPLQRSAAKVSWVKPENYHVTLKFLGDIDETLIPQLKTVSEEVTQSYATLTLNLNTAGAFPSMQKPRVIWIGTANTPGDLHQLAIELNAKLGKLGFPTEHSFKTHVTLGRVKEEGRAGMEDLSSRLQKLEKIETLIKVDHLTLMESQLTPQGAIYSPVFKSALAERQKRNAL